jgi:hypothetical protein
MTMMLIVISFIYICGYIPFSVSNMIRLVSNERIEWLARVSLCSLYLLIILKTFVYHSFNKQFRRTITRSLVFLLQIFRKECSSNRPVSTVKESTVIQTTQFWIKNEYEPSSFFFHKSQSKSKIFSSNFKIW